MADEKKKVRYGGTNLIDKLEEAAGIATPTPVPAPPKPATTAPKDTFTPAPSGLIPLGSLPEKQSSLRKRSVMGSAPYSDAELKQGYRKMGKGLGK